MVTLSPSLLAADFVNLRSQIDILKLNGIRSLHLDIMDGMYVPNISFGPPVIKSLRKYTDMFLDVHMMVEAPERYIDDMIYAGADSITLHIETCRHLDSALEKIRKSGKKTGVALNPATPVLLLDEILPFVDMVLVMSVNPGFGGQQFIEYTKRKIERLKAIKSDNALSYSIQVDGGVNKENIADIAEAGADNIVAGSAIFSGDISDNIRFLKGLLEERE
ncbi:ribulose-phosphate 3-epimerase [Johnsonella ignava ATCC 51276]|uniref:Ribulose-phosphate 3-epimerase n=1 Tax=Johnsonella ignava ATCC 51276 TaxID=679200 RepID=G5GH53_9FIRM|nr:ribulose-phosphate 3-epimerase [Johnsonella ignava]EHI55850.1 ribulose-phosphate 3-epimerase [Johnsonella ignava ATCC 51276]